MEPLQQNVNKDFKEKKDNAFPANQLNRAYLIKNKESIYARTVNQAINVMGLLALYVL